MIRFFNVRRDSRALLAAGLLAALPASLTAQGIDIPFSGGAWTFFGPSWYGTIGQTFRSPASDPFLQSFSFYLSSQHTQRAWSTVSYDPSSGVTFYASIRKYDGTLGGDLVFQSETRTVQGSEIFGFTPFDFGTGGVQLDPNALYVALLTSVNDGTHMGDLAAGWNGGAVLGPDLQAVATNLGGSDQTLLHAGYSQAFRASFSADGVTAAPEPASLTLLATGIVGIFGAARRKRSASSAS